MKPSFERFYRASLRLTRILKQYWKVDVHPCQSCQFWQMNLHCMPEYCDVLGHFLICDDILPFVGWCRDIFGLPFRHSACFDISFVLFCGFLNGAFTVNYLLLSVCKHGQWFCCKSCISADLCLHQSYENQTLLHDCLESLELQFSNLTRLLLESLCTEHTCDTEGRCLRTRNGSCCYPPVHKFVSLNQSKHLSGSESVNNIFDC